MSADRSAKVSPSSTKTWRNDLTERVARAIITCDRVDQDGRTVAQQVANEWADLEAREYALAQATDALAAVADAPGLEEVLRAHRLHFDEQGESCQDADWSETTGGDYETHLADVVRAWLRGEGT